MRSHSLFLLTVVPTFTFAVSVPRAGTKICGVSGYSTDTDAYYYAEDESLANYNKCSKQCLKDSGCKSFAFGDGVCMLFGVTCAKNLEAASDSPYTFYDASCVSDSTTTTTTTTKPTTTTTTTKPTTTTTTTKTTTTTTTPAKTSTTTTTSKKTTTTTTTTKSTTTTTTTTTKKTTTTSKTTGVSSTTSSVAVPSGCNIPTSYTIQSVNWFNSTHELDCITGPDVGDGTGCLDSNGNWCDPKTVAGCDHCGIGVCMTGLPPQPVGYGPPDSITVTFDDGTTCMQQSPGSVRRYEVGQGFVQCGGAYPFLNFYGNSNGNSNAGQVVINGYGTTCDDGRTIYGRYEGTVNLGCKHDAQFNATCASTGPAKIPLISYTF